MRLPIELGSFPLLFASSATRSNHIGTHTQTNNVIFSWQTMSLDHAMRSLSCSHPFARYLLSYRISRVTCIHPPQTRRISSAAPSDQTYDAVWN
jgi:hypothetical protein